MQQRHDAEKYIVRFPPGLREQIKERAASNSRSMNAEIVFHMKRAIERENEKGDANRS